MELTYSGLVDVVEASAEIEVSRVVRQAGTARSVTVDFGEPANRLRSDVDVRGCFDGARSIRVRDAVWDTGSMASAIDSGLARELGLPMIDASAIATLGGLVETSQYFVEIGLAEGMTVGPTRVNAVDMSSRPDGMRMLIGMDVISKGRLTVDSASGVTRMGFSLPDCP